MLISWMTSIERYIYLAKHSEPPQSFKVWSILVHLNSSFLPFFASLQSPSLSAGQFREQTHVRNLLLALVRSHSPSLLLGEAARSDLDRKKVDLYLGGLARIKENCIIFFNQISTGFKSLKASAPSASVESLASQKRKKLFDLFHLIWCRPFPECNGPNFLRLPGKNLETHSLFTFKNHGRFCWVFGVTWFGFAASPVREMEQQKLFSGCLLRTHCWRVMGFGSSLTRIFETNDFAWPVFPCRLLGLQWHILIPEPRKRSWIMHSDGSAKHEAIMKLQHSHVVLAGGCTVQTNWSHCRTENYWQCYRNADASWKWCTVFSRCSSHATRCQYHCCWPKTASWKFEACWFLACAACHKRTTFSTFRSNTESLLLVSKEELKGTHSTTGNNWICQSLSPTEAKGLQLSWLQWFGIWIIDLSVRKTSQKGLQCWNRPYTTISHRIPVLQSYFQNAMFKEGLQELQENRKVRNLDLNISKSCTQHIGQGPPTVTVSRTWRTQKLSHPPATCITFAARSRNQESIFAFTVSRQTHDSLWINTVEFRFLIILININHHMIKRCVYNMMPHVLSWNKSE